MSDQPTVTTAAGEPTVGQLVVQAQREFAAVVRGEVELAKAELKDSAAAAGRGAGMFGAAGFLGVVAFVLLSIAAAYGLVAAGLHPALAFLVVAGVYLLVALVLVLVGRSQLRKISPPERTKASLAETKAVLSRGGS
jgi:hypothetical protein